MRANAALTSGKSQLAGTLRSETLALGVGVAEGFAAPHAVRSSSIEAAKANFFMVNNLPDLLS
jgi:hypothetical protein